MTTKSTLWRFVVVLTWVLVASGVLAAGPISFSGQLDPALATFTQNGGDGSFNFAGAPNSIVLTGSDTGSGEPIYTLVTWSITSALTDLSFFWSYRTFDADGPSYDPAGYIINGDFFQLSNNNGADTQSGIVSGLNLDVGDEFGFYVFATDDIAGPAQLTIGAIPEPGTFGLLGLGLAGALLLGRRARSLGR